MMFLSTIIVGLLATTSASYLRQVEVESASNTTCVCTTVACPVAGSNTLTNAGGEIGTYIYANQGGHAVVTSAKVTVVMANLDHGSDTTSCTQDYSRSLDDDGVKDCDAGHILANRLGGSGNQPINIFPQDLSINRGSYAQYEGTIYDCIKTKGATSAKLSWTFSYESTSHTKPNGVVYKADFTGGSCTDTTMNFTN